MKRLFNLLFALITMASIMMVPHYAIDSRISLTEDEIIFLNGHPVIRLGVDPKFVPFEFIDSDGEYKGIAADYIALIRERTGIRFEVVQGLTWPEAYDMALAGDIDVLPVISKTEEREQHFLFSRPYYYFARVIVTRDTDTGISGIKDLERSAVAVQRNSSHHSYLLSYPRISVSLYDSVEAALTAVANGTERAFVGNLATTNYLIRANALTNLRFTAFEAEKQEALYFAVRKDWPELVSILNKALDSITQEERIEINNKWVYLETEVDYGPLIRTVSIISVLVAVVMTVSFYWIIRLRKEINKRQLIQSDLERAKQEADQADAFKSNFLARMSHEIRTPLNAIMGSAYLLKRTEISPTQGLYIDRVEVASKNMLSIINDVLDFSKIEAGKVELETASFSIDQVIQDVVSIVSYKIEEHEIRFRLFRDPLVPTWFLGDAKRIEEILINILNNAVKFTTEGEVSLDVRLVAREGDRYHLSFSIKDTGIGMTEEQVSKVFMPFMQGDSSVDRRFGGSGLGLSIAKNLVDMMGGQIQVHSTPGEGSTFAVNLSLLVDKDKEDTSAGILSANNSKGVRTQVLDSLNLGTVTKSQSTTDRYEKGSPRRSGKMHTALLVEDNKTNQLIAQTLLEQAGIKSIVADDGKDAVELYKQHKDSIDLILMDLHMPVMDGYEAAQEIRELSASVPIIAMTADVVFGVQEKCEQSGIYHYISKPFDPNRFIQTVREIIQNSKCTTAQDVRVLDRFVGLRNLGGDFEVYQEALNEFLNENQDTADKLISAIREGKYAEAAQVVHMVKGSLGSIGAVALYDLSISLQKALNEEDKEQIFPLAEDFSCLMERLLMEIVESQG